MDEVGFGLLTTAIRSAASRAPSRTGAWSAGSAGGHLRVGLVIETLTHLSLALTTSQAVAW